MFTAGHNHIPMLAQLNIEMLLLLVGLIMLTCGLLMRAAKRRRVQQGNQLTGREQIERMQQTSGMRGDLEHLMVEIEQLAKRLGSQLDVKAMRLEQLLRQADVRIAELQQLQTPPAPPRDDAATTPQAPAEPDPPTPEDPLARNIYQLADAGNDSIEIARQLSEHVGKVELILALRETP